MNMSRCKDPTDFARHTSSHNCRLRLPGMLLASFALLVLIVVPRAAWAVCQYTGGAAATVTFPGTKITLPTNPYPGLVLWTSPPQLVSSTTAGNCTSDTPNGITNQQGGQPTSGDYTLFPIGNSGLSYRILFAGNTNFPNTANGVAAYGQQPMPTANGVDLHGSYQLQLVLSDPSKLASLTANPVSGSLGHWDVDGCVFFILCSQINVVQFNTSSVTFVAPACNDPGVTVTLPTVFASTFTGTGSTTGTTSFSIAFTCTSSVKPSITLSTNSPQSGATGVIAPTARPGYAQNVGVRVLDQNGNAIQFGQVVPVTLGSGTSFNVPFSAQYYQTAPGVTAGQVQALATYTLTYQ